MTIILRSLSSTCKSKLHLLIEALGFGDVLGCWLLATLMSCFGLMFARVETEFAEFVTQALMIGSVPFWVGTVILTGAILLRDKSSA